MPPVSKNHYHDNLHQLQAGLVKLQRHFNAAGKDGTIKRVVHHLSPRETRVVALGAPSERGRTSWYFQRYLPYSPAARELVLFNLS